MQINPEQKFNNRFGMMIILGDFILPNQKTFWLDEFLTKLSWLGVLERTGRSTLARMAKDGWFKIEKVGRRNRYTLTTWGEAVLRQGDLRIFEQAVSDWDENWHLVIYSLPDEKRALRHNLVQQLSWLGYGRIARGSWISPHDRREALQQALKKPETNSYLHFFSGNYLGNTEITQLIHGCWELESVAAKYTNFIQHYEPILANLKKNKSSLSSALSIEDSFRHRFWISYDFLPLLRLDPNLPSRFLPTPWAGTKARQLYMASKDENLILQTLFSK